MTAIEYEQKWREAERKAMNFGNQLRSMHRVFIGTMDIHMRKYRDLKAAKRYPEADLLRMELNAADIVIEETPTVFKWRMMCSLIGGEVMK